MIFTKTLSISKSRILVGAICFLLLLLYTSVSGQSAWIPQDKICLASLRGLSVVDDDIIWASGSTGTWLRTSDGGETWRNGRIPSASQLDFRDIHAVSALKAWVISAGDTCKIFYTADGGMSWSLQYENSQKGIFFDGFAFWNEHTALAYSDPIDGKFFLIRTTDGVNWESIEPSGLPDALEGEAGFAASGTGIRVWGDSIAWIATGGGKQARVMKSTNCGATWTVYGTPLTSKEGTGIFSMVYTSQHNGIIVGGSYLDSTNSKGNCAITKDGGLTWEEIRKDQPHGYRSCVTATPDASVLLAVGRTGSEMSADGGLTWKVISKEGYYACATSNKYAWAVGRNGKIGKLTLEILNGF